MYVYSDIENNTSLIKSKMNKMSPNLFIFDTSTLELCETRTASHYCPMAGRRQTTPTE